MTVRREAQRRWYELLDALAGRAAELVELPGWDEIHAAYAGGG